jgi:hypothetical protein
MPTLTVPDETYQRLTERAGALHMPVDEYVERVLNQIATQNIPLPKDAAELAAEAAAFKAHLLGGPKFEDFSIERERDCGRTIEF